jgi:hypothetical protein
MQDHQGSCGIGSKKRVGTEVDNSMRARKQMRTIFPMEQDDKTCLRPWSPTKKKVRGAAGCNALSPPPQIRPLHLLEGVDFTVSGRHESAA